MPPEQHSTAETTHTDIASTETTGAADAVEIDTRKKPFVIVIIGIVLVALGYLAFFTDFFTTPPATVNGVAISQIELDNSIASITSERATQGVDTTSEQAQELIISDALNRLINTELLLQAAAVAGYNADPAAIDEQVAALTEQFGGEENLNNYLADLQLTDEMMREDIAEQLTVETYLINETVISQLTVTDEEVITFYNALRDQYGDQVPALGEIRAQIEADALGQKQHEMLGQVLAELRAKADVIIN